MSEEPSPDQGETVRQAVRDGYARIAQGAGACCAPTSCCGSPGANQSAMAAGYSEAELASLPEGANMGLSCGNPVALAALRPGETAVDLGSGGGLDVFIAGPRVGPAGRAIGVDMTPEMLAKARRNIAAYREGAGLDNVEFRLGEIEHLPLADDSVDVVISNCVINLSPDKPQVWREIARVLRPGGRVAVSDLALLQPLPEAARQSASALVGCVAGAALVEETAAMAKAAGLVDVELSARPDYVQSAAQWSDPLYRRLMESLPVGKPLSDYVTSLDVRARKPK